MNSINIQKTLIATCIVGVVGGLLGLGLLIHYRYQQNQPSAKSDEGGTPEQPSAGMQKKQIASTEATSLEELQAKKTPLIVHTKNKRVARRAVQVPFGDEFPLRLGSKGKRVERLRIWLMRNYGWTGIISDEFDKQTEELLKRYLKKRQLDETTYNKFGMGENSYGKS